MNELTSQECQAEDADTEKHVQAPHFAAEVIFSVAEPQQTINWNNRKKSTPHLITFDNIVYM